LISPPIWIMAILLLILTILILTVLGLQVTHLLDKGWTNGAEVATECRSWLLCVLLQTSILCTLIEFSAFFFSKVCTRDGCTFDIRSDHVSSFGNLKVICCLLDSGGGLWHFFRNSSVISCFFHGLGTPTEVAKSSTKQVWSLFLYVINFWLILRTSVVHILLSEAFRIIILLALLDIHGSPACLVIRLWFIQHLPFNHLLESLPVVAGGFSGKSDFRNFIVEVILSKEFPQIFVTTKFHMFKLLFIPWVKVDWADEGDMHTHASVSARTVNTKENTIGNTCPIWVHLVAVETALIVGLSN